MPPWQVERELSQEWYERWLAWKQAQSEARPGKGQVGQSVTLPDGTVKTRLV